MAGLRVAITALALLAAAPADAQSVVHWRPYIEAASARFGVPVEWIERVMRAESGGRTVLDGRPITSHAGAMDRCKLLLHHSIWRRLLLSLLLLLLLLIQCSTL